MVSKLSGHVDAWRKRAPFYLGGVLGFLLPGVFFLVLKQLFQLDIEELFFYREGASLSLVAALTWGSVPPAILFALPLLFRRSVVWSVACAFISLLFSLSPFSFFAIFIAPYVIFMPFLVAFHLLPAFVVAELAIYVLRFYGLRERVLHGLLTGLGASLFLDRSWFGIVVGTSDFTSQLDSVITKLAWVALVLIIILIVFLKKRSPAINSDG